jgi:hypothetical protein
MEKWFPVILNYINGENYYVDNPLNNFFDDNGFKSKLFIRNIGSAFLYFLIYALLWIVTAFMMFFGNWFEK